MAGESRSAMIAAAAALFRRHGYDATSWRQITAASGAPAGSIGFLFPDGKEQLASEVVASVGATTRDQIQELVAKDPDPTRATQRWIRASARILAESNFTNGCPLATLALEMAHRSDRIQREVATSYESWVEVLTEHLRPTHGDNASAAAEVLLAAFEGALLLARARRSTAPLETLAACIPTILGAFTAPADS